MPLSTVSAVVDPQRHGSAGSAVCSNLPEALRALTAGGARAYRCEEARPDHRRCGPPRPRRAAGDYTGRSLDAAGRLRGMRRAGSSSTSRRRLQPPGRRRGARRREGDHRHRLPPPRARFLRPLRDPGRAVLTDNGRAYISAPHALACRPPAPAPLHTPPPTADKRESMCLRIGGAVRLDGEAAHSRRSDSGKRHVEEAL